MKKKSTDVLVKIYDNYDDYGNLIFLTTASKNSDCQKYRVNKKLWVKYKKAMKDHETLRKQVLKSRVLVNNNVVMEEDNDNDYIEPER